MTLASWPDRCPKGHNAEIEDLVPSSLWDDVIKRVGELEAIDSKQKCDGKWHFQLSTTGKLEALAILPSMMKAAHATPFFDHCARQPWFLTRDPGAPAPTLEPHPKQELPNVTLSFSELKYLFECPYQFKLRVLYGFNPPLHEALGYGKGLHDALAEAHKRALDGDILGASAAEDLVDRHLHAPYAYPALKATLRAAAIKSVERYLTDHAADLERTVHSEKQIQVHVAPGITVDGRIDLVRRLDSDEVAIVDFKSTARAQDEDVTRDQLHVYAVGYQELTGERADLIEVLNLDEQGKTIRELVADPLLSAVRGRIKAAGDALRDNDLPRLPVWEEKCSKCDLAELCRDVPAVQRKARRAASGR